MHQMFLPKQIFQFTVITYDTDALSLHCIFLAITNPVFAKYELRLNTWLVLSYYPKLA
jgi:hypothetical protein